jgi:hypothetical protein
MCDPDELCPGVAEQSCPINVFEPATTICSPGSGDMCDPDEFCPGLQNQTCPFDFVQPPFIVCNQGASLVTVTLAGFSVNGIVGLSTDPSSGLLYGIVKTGSGVSGRRLASIDPSTGVATDIGPLPDGFANIEFGSGGLWGVTGNGAPVPETFYSVNIADASTTFIQLLGNGSDGESIAFNPVDGLMYHWSGFASAITQIMETINLDNQVVTNVPVDFAFYDPREVFGSTYDPSSGDFLFSDTNGELGSVTPGGVFSLIGSLPLNIRGLAYNGGTLYGSEKSGSTLYALDPSLGGILSDLCDPDELCPGIADQTCPVDFFEPASTVCNVGSGDICNPDELCPGIADQACPVDLFEPASTVCNVGSGDICDPDELCPGVVGAACPAGDTQLAAAGTLCNPGSGDICDPDEVCSGLEDDACPADSFDPGTAVCNPGSGDLCDPDELCPGIADTACPADVFDPGTLVCNPGSGDLCDPDELCPGVADDPCPPDFVEDDGTSCVDGDVCNGDEVCASGSCAPAISLDCDDADECTADSCDEISGCFHEPICGPVPVPAASNWGRALVGLFMLALGALSLIEHRSHRARSG